MTRLDTVSVQTRRPVSLIVNGVRYDRDVETRLLLSDSIRHELGLTGTHVGCEHGVCSCCTVLIDGRRARSCRSASGSRADRRRDPRGDQRQPLPVHGLHEHRGRRPPRGRADALRGSVLMATRSFGERVLRNEDDRLLRGNGMYIDDIPDQGVLHAAFVRSACAHADITRADVACAREHPGVVAVYRCDDIGHVDRELPLLIPHPFMQYPKTQRPLARGHSTTSDRRSRWSSPRPVTPRRTRASSSRSTTSRCRSSSTSRRWFGRTVRLHDNVPENVTSHFVQQSVASNHERLQIHEIELAATKDSIVTGIRGTFLHDTGAFIPYGIAVAQVSATQLPGPYRVPSMWVELKAVYTNTMTVTPYRGCGRPHACFVIERAMDLLAEELGTDGMLFTDGLPVTLDSGNYHEALGTVLPEIDYEGSKAEQDRARQQGRYLGLGLACYIEGTGLGPYEGAHVKVDPITGQILVATGLTTQGQALKTTFAQIAADALGASPANVQVVTGDTREFEWGVATFASRAAVVSGSAIGKAALEVRRKALEFAANMLEASADDFEIQQGEVFVRGSRDRFVTLKQIATAANPLRYAFDEDAQGATQFAPARKNKEGTQLPEESAPGLVATEFYSPPTPPGQTGSTRQVSRSTRPARSPTAATSASTIAAG